MKAHRASCILRVFSRSGGARVELKRKSGFWQNRLKVRTHLHALTTFFGNYSSPPENFSVYLSMTLIGGFALTRFERLRTVAVITRQLP
jgi:hypothetical protein